VSDEPGTDEGGRDAEQFWGDLALRTALANHHYYDFLPAKLVFFLPLRLPAYAFGFLRIGRQGARLMRKDQQIAPSRTSEAFSGASATVTGKCTVEGSA
jgi:hypothetical protein